MIALRTVVCASFGSYIGTATGDVGRAVPSLRTGTGYDRPHDHAGVEDRRGLRRHGRDAVPRPSAAAGARLRPRAASGPHRLRDLRDAVAGARQRHSGLPRAERRCARGGLLDDAGRGEHEGRLPRRGARRRQRPRPRLVGRHDRSRQGVRHRPVLRRQHEPARRLPRHDGTVVHEPGDGPALRVRLSGDHRRRHGAGRARAPGRARDHAAGRRRRRLARRHAGARVGRAVRRSRSTRSFRSRARTRSSRRASPGMRSRATPSPPIRTGRAATTTAPAARRRRAWAWRAWSDTSPICPPRRSTTSSDGGCSSRDDIRYTLTEPEFEVESYLRHQADTFVKRFDANTYLYTSRALSYFDLARQYGGGRLAHALRNVSAQNAAHRVQLRLALSAVGLRGAGGRASRRRQGGRAPRDRRAVRTRLLSVGGGAPDSYDSGVPRALGVGAASMEESRQLRIRNPSGARRAAPGPEYRRARGADLSDDELRVRGSRIGGRVLQPAGVREHLLAHHEPDGGRVRGAHGQPRRRLRRRRVRQRDRGAGGGAVHAAVARRPRRVVVGAVRRDGQSVQAPAAQDVGGADVGRSRRSRRVEGGRPRQHQGVLRRDDRQPRRQRARHRGDRGHCARPRAAADRRQHVRDAVSLPPDRVGRGHRPALGDEVHRRPRHEHRRRGRRLGAVQLVERPLSGRRRSVAGLSRAPVPRDVRHLRLSDEAAGRDAARSRRVP